MKAFIEGQFGHCPLAYMFYERMLNRKIIAYSSAYYKSYIETAQVFSMNCYKKTILSLFPTGSTEHPKFGYWIIQIETILL